MNLGRNQWGLLQALGKKNPKPPPPSGQSTPHPSPIPWLDLCIWLPTFWAGGSTLWSAAILRAAAIFKLSWPMAHQPLKFPLSHLLFAVMVLVQGWTTKPWGLATGFWLQLGFIYLVAQAATTLRPSQRLRWWLAAHRIATVHCVWALFRFGLDGDRGVGGFVHANDTAAFLLPLWLHALIHCHMPHPTGRAWARGQFLLLSCTLWSCLSRGAVITAVLAAACLPPRRKQHAQWRRLALILLLIVAGTLVWHRRHVDVSDVSRFARLHIWQACLEVIGQHPLGVGWGRFPMIMRQHGIWSNPILHYGQEAHHAHNEWLMLVVEGGWIMIPILAWLLTRLLLAIQALEQRQRRLAWASCSVFLLPASVSASLRLPCVALLAGLTWGQWSQVLRSLKRSHRWPQPWNKAQATVCMAIPWQAAAACCMILLLPGPMAGTLSQWGQQAFQGPHKRLALMLAQAGAHLAPWRLQSQMLVVRLQQEPWFVDWQDRPQAQGTFPQLPQELARLAATFSDHGEPWIFAASQLQAQCGAKDSACGLSPKERMKIMSAWLLEGAKRTPYRYGLWLQLARLQHKAQLIHEARRTLLYLRWLEPHGVSAMIELAHLDQRHPLWSHGGGGAAPNLRQQMQRSQALQAQAPPHLRSLLFPDKRAQQLLSILAPPDEA